MLSDQRPQASGLAIPFTVNTSVYQGFPRALRRVAVSVMFLLLFVVPGTGVALAQQTPDVRLDSPYRGIVMATSQAKADLSLTLTNQTNTPQTVQFSLTGVPSGWDVGVWDHLFDFRISRFVVQPTSTTATPTPVQLYLRIMPPTGVKPGDYSFTLHVSSANGSVTDATPTYHVTVVAATPSTTANAAITSDSPTLEGPPGQTLQFQMDVKNNTSNHDNYNLSAQAPSGWQVTFQEAYGSKTDIGAVGVAANNSQTVSVNVAVPSTAAAGSYNIPVVASSSNGQASITLHAKVAGKGNLSVTTDSGSLNLSASAGGTGSDTLVFKNSGSAGLKDVKLTANAPANWKVTFGEPNNIIPSLPAGNQIKIPVTISPPGNAVSGDYLVTINGASSGPSASTHLRVTVSRFNLWGWLGIALVVLVVGGAIGLMLRLGRR